VTGRRQFGAIRKLPSGSWQARYRHPVTNRLVSAPVTFTTKADAGLWLATLEADLGRGQHVDRSAGEVALREYADRWLAERELRPRSRELYRGLLDRYLLPQLGDLTLGRLSPSMVRAWNADLRGQDRPGAVTVAKAYRLLHAICATAVEDELIPRNPCNVKGASVERSPERPVISVEQIAALAEAIEPRYRIMVLLAAWCGLRLGEVLALNVTDVDLETGVLLVDKTMLELKSGERFLGPPKSAAGRRVVAMPPHILPEVAEHVRRFCPDVPDGLLVTGDKGGPVRRLVLHKLWKQAASAIGVPQLHFHDLRHTGATLAAATGASTRELMLRLGHSSPTAALRYQHATMERDAVIAKALSDLALAAQFAAGRSELRVVDVSVPPADGDDGGTAAVQSGTLWHGEEFEGGSADEETPEKWPSTRDDEESGRRGSNSHHQLGRLRFCH